MLTRLSSLSLAFCVDCSQDQTLSKRPTVKFYFLTQKVDIYKKQRKKRKKSKLKRAWLTIYIQEKIKNLHMPGYMATFA
jgi:hypothetical protein